MQPKSPREREDDQRLKERAAEWLGELKTAGPAERAEFAAWVRESPKNLEEFLFATVAAEAIRRVDPASVPALQEKLAAAPQNVVPLPLGSSAPSPLDGSADSFRKAQSAPGNAAGDRSSWRRPLAWAAGLAAIGIAAFLTTWGGGETYATAVGEQRSVELADRSIIHLNGLSRIKVRFSTQGREVQLLSGEALFKVAADSARPFRVLIGTTVVHALGTEFNVLRRSSGITVSVVEGLVQVSAQRLAAGEEARVALDGRIERRASIDVVTVSAWRQHRLVFRGETLTDVAAEFNRYNRTPQIVVEGNVAQARRFSGVFDADDPRSLITSLREDAGLELEDSPDRLVIRVQ